MPKWYCRVGEKGGLKSISRARPLVLEMFFASRCQRVCLADHGIDWLLPVAAAILSAHERGARPAGEVETERVPKGPHCAGHKIRVAAGGGFG